MTFKKMESSYDEGYDLAESDVDLEEADDTREQDESEEIDKTDLLKLYLLSAFVFRFSVESVRGNQVQAFGLTGPQIVLLPLVVLLLLHFARQIRSGVYTVPPPPLIGDGRSALQEVPHGKA